jgi:hypothetical protein
MTGELNLDEVVTQSKDTTKKGAEVGLFSELMDGQSDSKVRIF